MVSPSAIWLAIGLVSTGTDSIDLGEVEPLDDLQELDALLATENPDAGLQVSARGSLKAEARVFVEDRAVDAAKDEQLQVEALAHFSMSQSGAWTARLVPWLLIDLLDTELLRYEPLEAYVSYRATSWDLRAGQFIEAWGVTDAFSPLNILTRIDYAPDLLDGKRRGELGARVRWSLPGGNVIGEPTVSLYVLPVWRRPELPTSSNRYAFPNVRRSPGPRGAEAVFSAARFESTLSSRWFNADAQVLAARGPARIFAAIPAASEVTLGYFGVWTFGVGLRAVPNSSDLSSLTFKIELVEKVPYALEASVATPRSFFQYVIGTDWSAASVLGDGDSILLTVEWLGELGEGDDQSLFRPFRSDLAARIGWQAGDFASTTIDLTAVLDVFNAEAILEATAERHLPFLADAFSAGVLGRLVRPAKNDVTLLAGFPTRTSEVRLFLAWSW